MGILVIFPALNNNMNSLKYHIWHSIMIYALLIMNILRNHNIPVYLPPLMINVLFGHQWLDKFWSTFRSAFSVLLSVAERAATQGRDWHTSDLQIQMFPKI